MKKKRSLSNKGMSSIQLNWDAVRSFLRDVEVKDKIPTEASIEAFEPKTNSIITEKKESSKEGSSVLIEKVFVDRTLTRFVADGTIWPWRKTATCI